MSSEANIQKLHIPVATQEPRARKQNFSLKAAVARSESDAPVKGVVLMGLGSEGVAPKRAAKLAAARGLTDVLMVQGLHYNLAYPDKNGLIDMAVQSTRGVADYARNELNATRLHGVGESQGGPAMLESVLHDPEAIDGAVVLLHSIGAAALSTMDFMKRMARSGLQRDQFHGAAPLIAGAAMYRAGEDAVRTGDRRGAQMEFILRGYQLAPRLGKLAAEQPDRDFYLATGDKDFVVPPVEQIAALESVGLGGRSRIIPGGSHSTLASPAGAEQLVQATELWMDRAALPGQHKAA